MYLLEKRTVGNGKTSCHPVPNQVLIHCDKSSRSSERALLHSTSPAVTRARGVLNDHPENQFLNFLRRLSSPDGPPDLGEHLPVQTESALVPTHHGFGRDRNEGFLPSGPESADSDPEELVEQI